MAPVPQQYNHNEAPLRVVFNLSGSVLAKVAQHPAIYVFVGLNAVVFSATSLFGWHPSNSFSINKHHAHLMSVITTFFEVFYTSVCYSRYMQLWDINRKMCGRIYDFILQVRILIPNTGKPYDRLASRWLVVAHLLFLNEQRSGKESNRECWNKLLALDLVNNDEIMFLSALQSSQRSLVLLHAAADLVRTGLAEVKAPIKLLPKMVTSLQEYRDLQQEVADYGEFQFPFGYFHLANLMVTAATVSWSYAMGLSVSMFAPLFFFFTTIVFMGVLDLAAQLADPFGDDDADFPIHYWAAELLENLTVLLGFEHAGSTSGYEAELQECVRTRPRLDLDLAEVASVLFGTESLPSPTTASRPDGFSPGSFAGGGLPAGQATDGHTATDGTSPESSSRASPSAHGGLISGRAGGGKHDLCRDASLRGLPSRPRYSPMHIETGSA